jgi:hypothetical protein
VRACRSRFKEGFRRWAVVFKTASLRKPKIAVGIHPVHLDENYAVQLPPTPL